jgi:hypothetical protein
MLFDAHQPGFEASDVKPPEDLRFVQLDIDG